MADAPARAKTPNRPSAEARRAAELLSRLGPRANATRGLATLVSHAAEFAGQGQLLDERALVLGLLASGLSQAWPLDPAGNSSAAVWYTQWLAHRLDEDRIRKGLEAARDGLSAGVAPQSLAISPQLQGLFAQAVDLAAATVKRDVFDLRHLVAAMTLAGVLVQETNAALGVQLTVTDIGDFAQRFVDRIENRHEPDEDPNAWRAAFASIIPPSDQSFPASSQAPATDATTTAASGPAGVAAEPERSPPLNTNRITGFDPDGTDPATDPLDTEADVEALAKLICLEEVTPLSVAVFGGWGAGKTTFMTRLSKQVRKIADGEAARREGVQALGQGSRRYVRSLVPIWFNAWQFVDSNLWASLTAELFDQLRSGGREGAEADQHAALVDKVNQHVRDLSDEAKAKLEAAAQSAKTAEQARSARDDAAKQLKTASAAVIDQAALQAFGEAYRNEKPLLDALGLSSARGSVETFLSVAQDSLSAGGKLKAIGWIVWRRRRLVLGLAMIALFALVALGLLVWSGRLLPRASLAPALLALATLVGSAAQAVTPAARLVYSIAGRSAAVAVKAQRADADAANAFLKQEDNLRHAAAEARQRQVEADVAAKALSFYADPSAPSNPPRLLRYLLEDDPDTRALEKEIGLIGRTRRLFQALDSIMQEKSSVGGAKDAGRRSAEDKRLERIVIFIDDLDRCTEEQVYHALQATQLLLAFKSFVVVVGVDVDWVRRTLERQIGGAEAGPQKAVDYLEKIFQVAFWLAPLSGPDGGGYAAYVHGLADPRPPTPPTPPQVEAPADAPAGRPDLAQPEALRFDAEVRGGKPADLERIDRPADEQGDIEGEGDGEPATLEIAQLDQLEADFLASEAIAGVAAPTPRSVKRLVNVYRLVRSRMERAGASLLGDPPDYPLIAFFVAIETGQPAAIANGVYDGLKALAGADSIANLDLAGRTQRSSPSLGAPEALANAAHACPALGAAFDEMLQLRKGQLSADEALKVARIARRYSFNRFR